MILTGLISGNRAAESVHCGTLYCCFEYAAPLLVDEVGQMVWADPTSANESFSMHDQNGSAAGAWL